MRDIGIVYGSEAQAQPIVIGKDTVYVHTNIRKLERKNEDGVLNKEVSDEYEYYEVQYTLKEWEELQKTIR